MDIYVVRHGQTDWNVKGMLQGKTDIPLNEMGIKQAEELRKKIKNLSFAKVFSSPLSRAKKTAEIIADNNPIIYDERISERCLGVFEGKDKFNISDFWNYNSNLNEKNVEKLSDFFSRVYNFLDERKQKEENILIVTHGGTILAINSYFNGIPEDGNVKVIKTNNCTLLKYEI